MCGPSKLVGYPSHRDELTKSTSTSQNLFVVAFLLERPGLTTVHLLSSGSCTVHPVFFSCVPGTHARKRDYCFVIKAGLWQAALPLHDKVLVGCSVAPGFEFQDFELIDPAGGVAGGILKHSPDLVRLVYP